MRYFFDTEFDQESDPEHVNLISIGIVAEDGREYYAVTHWYNDDALNARLPLWLRQNVLPKLWHTSPTPRWKAPETIKYEIEKFVYPDNAWDDPYATCSPVIQDEWWAYYGAYDWYLLTRLWGFMHLPPRFPMLCMDVKQLHVHLGSPAGVMPSPFEPQHNALIDARWTKAAWEALTKYAATKES